MLAPLALLLPLLLLLAVTGALTAAAWLRIRRERHRQIVQTLAVIVGQGLSLAPALRAVAAGERRGLRGIYQGLARWLEQGEPLSRALERVQPKDSGRVVSALRAAERGGTTSTVLRNLAAELRIQSSTPVNLGAPTLYSFVMLGTLALLLVIFMLAIVPKLRDIFRDFDTKLPALTELVIELFGSRLWWVAILALVTTALGLLGLCLRRGTAAAARERVPHAVRIYDRLWWSVPGVRRLLQGEALGRQLPVLQAALRAGEDLPAAARQAGAVDANYCARRRLWRWATLLTAGNDPVEAARRADLPQPLVRTLAAARSGGDLATALEYLALYYRSLVIHWRQVIISSVLPVMVVLWALVVGLIVVSLFLPLVCLIQAVTASLD